MSKQSSKETRQRARDLAAAIGAYHCNLDIDQVYEAQRNLIINTLNFEPKFKVEGGSISENLTLQNIQAVRKLPGDSPSSIAGIHTIYVIDEFLTHISPRGTVW